MKKRLCLLMLIAFCVGLYSIWAPQSYAQTPGPTSTPATPIPATPTAALTPTPTATAALPGQSDNISFSELGVAEDTLRGPYSVKNISFTLPPDWELTEGVAVRLDIATFFGGVGIEPLADDARQPGGSLEVAVNGVIIGAILLDRAGERTVTIPFSEAVLAAPPKDSHYDLSLSLDSGLGCEFDRQTVVAIHATSRLILSHRVILPSTDLANLPRPIYQGSFLPDAAALVVPDQPTASELQAALIVAAGFGRMTEQALTLSLIPLEQLTAEIRDNTHLIFVGRPADFSILLEAALPAPIKNSAYQADSALADDGIVQMVVSPWNSSKVVLVVGGNTEAAVIKAGQAVSTGMLRPAREPNLALIASVNTNFASATGVTTITQPDQVFADLGYGTRTARRSGVNTLTYLFEVPPGYVAGLDAALDLVFSHAALLNFDRSGLAVTLNDEPIGGVRFTETSAAQNNKMRFALPASAVRSGPNRLTIKVELVPRVTCQDARLTDLWFTVRSESLLHLPLTAAPVQTVQVSELREYPRPFSLDPSLSHTAFVVSPADPAGWDVAAFLAFDLGGRTDGALANLRVVYDGAIPDNVRQEFDLLVVGRPSTLAIVAELGDALPAPFEAGSDLALERNVRVGYRLSADVSIGYLELLPSPWNDQRRLMAVLGNSVEGLQWASMALKDPALRGGLIGNFAVINDTQITVGEARLGDATVVAAATAIPAGGVESPAAITPTASERPEWILPALGGSVLLMAAIVAVAAIMWWRQHRPGRRHPPEK